MRRRPSLAPVVFACLALSCTVPLSACSDTGAMGEDGGTAGDSGSQPGGCEDSASPQLEFGEGIGSAFTPWDEGQEVLLEFASQAGVELSVALRSDGIAPETITEIDVLLTVDGYPVGLASTAADQFRCEEEQGRLRTVLPIDISQHPDLRLISDIDGRTGTLSATLKGDAEAPITTELQVTLSL